VLEEKENPKKAMLLKKKEGKLNELKRNNEEKKC